MCSHTTSWRGNMKLEQCSLLTNKRRCMLRGIKGRIHYLKGFGRWTQNWTSGTMLYMGKLEEIRLARVNKNKHGVTLKNHQLVRVLSLRMISGEFNTLIYVVANRCNTQGHWEDSGGPGQIQKVGAIVWEGGLGARPQENFEILHALKCVLRACQVSFCTCIQYISTC